MTVTIVWVVCAIVGGVIVRWKQKGYLTEEQPLAFLMCGPITLLLSIVVPAKYFTSREKAEGK